MPPRPRFDRRAPVRELPNINERIKYPQLRVVDSDGKQLGVIDRLKALEIASQRELDLVLVSEKANPPVCRIMDYGKYKFEQEKKAIEKILSCKKGKVILSGVGKSGIIAKKISSTLASVGTPSFFVDASSCSHGDLGQISSNDILILISNSGESIELKNIIQFANRNKNITLIGIVSKKK